MQPDDSYWHEFYKSGRAPTFSSQFAVFVQSWIQGQRARIYEFGAGNGRDAGFFHGLGHIVHASDQVASAELQELAASSQRFFLEEGDVIGTSALATPENSDEVQTTIVYSRFFQHAIPQEVEDEMLVNLRSTLPVGALCFFEFRIDEDEALPKTFDGHYRRYQPAASFIERASATGMELRYSVTGSGFANYRSEDPIVGRFVFEQV